MIHIKLTLNRTVWRHRAVWQVGSDVLSHSTEPNPQDVSRMFQDASDNCTRTPGVMTPRKDGIDKFCPSYCNGRPAAHIRKRTEGSLLLPDFFADFLGSVKTTNKIQPCNRIYYSKIY